MEQGDLKVAVVTGAGSGIGRASALALAANGFSLALLGRRKETVDSAADEIEAAGGTALALGCDVTDKAQVQAAFAATVERFGRIDVLFNNAGIGAPRAEFEDLDLTLWQRVVDVNLTGSFLCSQEAFRAMKAQDPRGGRIINNGSVSAHAPRPGSAAYTATKHAVTGLTKSLSLDGRRFDIACGQIDIGNAETGIVAGIVNGAEQPDGRIVPEPVMPLQSVADAVVFMATQPLTSNVQFMTIMATKMPLIGRG